MKVIDVVALLGFVQVLVRLYVVEKIVLLVAKLVIANKFIDLVFALNDSKNQKKSDTMN